MTKFIKVTDDQIFEAVENLVNHEASGELILQVINYRRDGDFGGLILTIYDLTWDEATGA